MKRMKNLVYVGVFMSALSFYTPAFSSDIGTKPERVGCLEESITKSDLYSNCCADDVKIGGNEDCEQGLFDKLGSFLKRQYFENSGLYIGLLFLAWYVFECISECLEKRKRNKESDYGSVKK